MLVIKNGQIHTITNGIIERGTIIIENGKITAIGTNLSIPAGARVIDAEGKWVQPGIIEAHSHLGVSEQGLGFEGNDTNEMVDPSTPHVRAIDGLNPNDLGFQDALEGGVTAAWVTPGSANVIGGQGATVRTYGRTVEDMTLIPYSAMKAALGENPKRVYSAKSKIATRMGSVGYMREQMYKAKAYLRKIEVAQEKGTDLPDYDARLEPLVAVLRKEVPMRIHAHRADDIMTALRFAREFDFNLCIEHCTEGHLIVEELKSEPRLLGVAVGPTFGNRGKVETAGKSFETAGILQRAGIRVTVTTDHPVIPVQYLAFVTGLCAKAGMDEEEALKAITLNAAVLAGVGDRTGSLEVGKDADIAIFTGTPFDAYRTETVATIVAGEVAYKNPKFF